MLQHMSDLLSGSMFWFQYGTDAHCTLHTGAPAKHPMRVRALEGEAADADRAAASCIRATGSCNSHGGRGAAAPLPRHCDCAGRRRCRAAQRAADVGVDGCKVGDALRLAVFEPAKQRL